MALKTFVKISNVNNLSDARYCAGMYVDLIGFCVEADDPEYVSPDQFKEITSWLSGPEFVAEFKTTDPEKIRETLGRYPGITYVQAEKASCLHILENTGYQFIIRKSVEGMPDLAGLIDEWAAWSDKNVILLLESNSLPELTDAVAATIRDLAANGKVLLGFGLQADTITDVLEQTNVMGISLRGGHEIKPGLKDFDELSEILEALDDDQ
ncbi:Phosphoribosylanthranilate isomerase [Lunatimonas lonarensis]|uniref:Phosphoribosylanthranilate isomerase n=1 Tax=Lunatimonas lonarensis TaxID=1232681 RepID=R7ZRD6_9BACT|nr:phosphoribosylanthranilate isomerase [Lunatimonas lonarensis]EON76716.1 Phosphoribosylanthranilate isomerase [Lunatimonas lonarensis]